MGNRPLGRYGAAAFSAGGKGYLGTGTITTFTKDFWEYDPVKDTWTQKADFAGNAREFASGFSIGNRCFVGFGFAPSIGGTLENVAKDFWEYDVAQNAWIRKADFPGEGRQGAVAFTIGSKAYVGLGYNSYLSTSLNDFWEYDPISDHWRRLQDFSISNNGGVIALGINDKGYLFSGRNAASSDVWEYNPNSDTWKSMKELALGMSGNAFGFTISGKAYVGTASGKKELWQFDPIQNTWYKQPGFPGSDRQFAFSFAIGQYGFVGSGFEGAFLTNKTDVWKFDPGSGWSQHKALSETQRKNAVAFSIGQKGYVGTGLVHGMNVQNYRSDFWEFDPIADLWTQKADVPGLPRENAIGFNIGTKGYVGAGSYFDFYRYETLTDFWEYDATSNKWSQKAAIPAKTGGAAFGFSVGDKGYVGIRSMRVEYVQKDLLEYSPAIDRWTKKSVLPDEISSDATAFSIGTKAYVVTRGLVDSTTSIWEFNPSSGAWLRKSELRGVGRRDGISFSLGGKGYFGLGTDHTGYEFLRDLWQYDPLLNSCTRMRDYPGLGSQGAVAFRVGNKAYAGTGAEFVATESELWEYTPPNEAPIANGWLMKYYSPTSVLLNAWGSYDPEASPLKFWWEKISGPSSYRMLYQNASTPVIADLVAGTYKFQLTVTDMEGATGKDTVVIGINTLSYSSNIGSALYEQMTIFNKPGQIRIFPNPATDILLFNWSDAYYGAAEISVIDGVGRIIKTMDLKKDTYSYIGSMQLSMNGGTYFFIVKTRGGPSYRLGFIKK